MTDPIEQELILAQRAYRKGLARYRAAVANAYRERPPTDSDDGEPKSIYWIAQVLGVQQSAVRSVLKTAADLEAKKEEP